MLIRRCASRQSSCIFALLERSISKSLVAKFSASAQPSSSSGSSDGVCALSGRLQSFKSISKKSLGESILHWSSSKDDYTARAPHEVLRKGVIAAKVLSLSSSALGIVMVPVLTKYIWDAATESPAIMAFAVLANTVLGMLSLTPFLLQFLVKRFIVDVYYNPETKVRSMAFFLMLSVFSIPIFTTVHYGFWINKRALRFRAEDIADAAVAPEMRKLWLPLATAFVYGYPLLLSLDSNAYVNKVAFGELTRNIVIPPGSD